MRDILTEIYKELSELNSKCNNLSAFLGSEFFKTLVPEHAGLLQRQYHHMYEYKNILEQRIALLRNQG